EVPDTVLLAHHSDVPRGHGFAKEVIRVNLNACVLTWHVVATIRFRRDGEIRELVTAHLDERLDRVGVVVGSVRDLGPDAVVSEGRAVGYRAIGAREGAPER